MDLGGLSVFSRAKKTGERHGTEQGNGRHHDHDFSQGGRATSNLCQRNAHSYSRQQSGFQSYKKIDNIPGALLFQFEGMQLRPVRGGS